MEFKEREKGSGEGPVKAAMEAKLLSAFAPVELQVINESFMHNVPAGSESHFKVILVSETLEGKQLLARHRSIQGVLSDELAGLVHALSIEAYTPQEWSDRGGVVSPSPLCLGGSKVEEGSN
jgi:BolA protein